MTTISNVVSVLERLKKSGRIDDWELPYAKYLKRLDAAIFFVETPELGDGTAAWEELRRLGQPTCRRNEQQLASRFKWEVRFAGDSRVPLDASQIEQFKRNGFVVLDSLLSEERVRQMTEAMDRVYGGVYTDDRRPAVLRQTPMAPFGNEQSIRWMLNSRVVDRDIWDLATDAGLGEIAARLLETDSVSIIEDQLLDKPAHGLPVNMHQDYAYWPFSSSAATATCWISLMDNSASCGGLSIVRGSHRWGAAAKPQKLVEGSEDQWLAALASVRSSSDGIDLVDIDVPRGGGVYFHGLTFHGSSRNPTAVTRRACSLHWAGGDARAVLGNLARVDHPYLFAGIENGGPLVNGYMPRVYPTYTVDP
jgi:ectoine hydroxylase-related dioxygenase (phytanoyl-CoA dioxygenase family)